MTLQGLLVQADVIGTLKRAQEITGGPIGKTGKMPCSSYNLAAKDCITGTRLQSVEGSVCHDCYAMGGNYQYPSVKLAMERHMAAIEHELWPEAMAYQIVRKSPDYFRMHDSGDLQGIWHLRQIVRLAELVPDCTIWMPTRETAMLAQAEREGVVIPPNLIIRRSMHMVGDMPSEKGIKAGRLFSTVSEGHVEGVWNCPSLQQGNTCGDCRKCWDPNTPIINYTAH